MTIKAIRYTIIAIIIALVQLSLVRNLDLILIALVFIAFDDTIEAAIIVAFMATIITSLLTNVLVVPLIVLGTVTGLIWFAMRTVLATKTLVSLMILGTGTYMASVGVTLISEIVLSLFGGAVPGITLQSAGVFFYKLAIDLVLLLVLYAIFSRSKYAARAFLITGR